MGAQRGCLRQHRRHGNDRDLVDRTELARRLRDADTSGWLTVSADLRLMIPLPRRALEEIRDLTAETLATAGIEPSTRAVVALNSDGAGLGTAWSEAASLVAECSCSGPVQSPPRLIRLVEQLQADALITNPTTAARLVRFVRRSGADPSSLPIRRLYLTGEVTRPRNLAHLERAFAAEAVEIWSDPVFGIALASATGAQPRPLFRPTRPHVLDWAPVRTAAHGRAIDLEWVVVPTWAPALDGLAIRTGVVSPRAAGELTRPLWTVGDHVQIRGRWLDLEVLRGRLDELRSELSWCLSISRTIGSDRVTLHVGRATSDELEYVHAIIEDWSPIRVAVIPVRPNGSAVNAVVDRRGYHLGARLP